MLFMFDNHCSNISLKKSKEKNKKKSLTSIPRSRSPSKEIKNKEKNSSPKWLKKLKKEMLVIFRKKKLLTSEMPRLKVGV